MRGPWSDCSPYWSLHFSFPFLFPAFYNLHPNNSTFVDNDTSLIWGGSHACNHLVSEFSREHATGDNLLIPILIFYLNSLVCPGHCILLSILAVKLCLSCNMVPHQFFFPNLKGFLLRLGFYYNLTRLRAVESWSPTVLGYFIQSFNYYDLGSKAPELASFRKTASAILVIPLWVINRTFPS